MRNKVYLYLALTSLMVVLGMSSCSETDSFLGTYKEEKVIRASIEQSALTRTCVDETNSGETTGICWSVPDTIGVFSDDGVDKNAMFISTNTTQVGEADFYGTMSSTPAYAYYPYSNNNSSVSYNAVSGKIPSTQQYSTAEGRLYYDYKVGTPEDDSGTSFTFKHLFSMLRITVDATNTVLSDEMLESVTLTFPEGTKASGEFTVDLATEIVSWTTEGNKILTLNWTDKPSLSGNTLYGYLTCAPLSGIQNQTVSVSVVTTNYVVSFSTTLNSDFTANTVYTFPLNLSEWASRAADYSVVERPSITSMTFTAESNSGKILDKKLLCNSSGETSCVENSSVDMAIDDSDNITGCIPYLYDFNLVPTISYTDGATIKYSYDGESFTDYSEGDKINFSNPVIFRVSKGNAQRIYTVKISNTGLPVVVINLDGGNTTWSQAGIQVYSKDTDFDDITGGTMSVYKADGTAELDGVTAAVRLRGNSTQNFPKKPFAIKLDKKSDILGIMNGEKHKRWVLLANWKDRTLMRNAVAFDLAQVFQTTLTDGLKWNPRGTFVEVVYNGVHVGNYYLCEQIKIDGGRLNISDPYEKDNGTITTDDLSRFGYLLECDDNYDETAKFTTKGYIPVMFKDDVDDGGVILNYVQNKIQGIETNLYNGNYSTAYENLDINSIIDYWIFQELVMCEELGHPKSVYLYMDGLGKLSAGPVWDFDWQAFPVIDNIINMYNETSYALTYTTSMLDNGHANPWYKVNGTPTAPITENDRPFMWYPMLFKDTDTFRPLAQERWTKVKASVMAYAPEILEMGKSLAVSWKYNDEMWPVNAANRKSISSLGGGGYAGDEDMDFEEAYTTLYNTLMTRIEGMSFIETQTYPTIAITRK